MKTVFFDAGTTILSEGDDGDSAFLIINGSAEVIVGAGAKARNVGTLEAGDVFGEMSLIEPGPRSATVKALTDTECLVTAYDEFIASIQEDPEHAVAFMRTLVRRLRHMNGLLADLDPARRSLRALFKDWQVSHEDAEKARQIIEKMNPMF